MNSLTPWCVDGVEPEAQEAAKLSARKADVPLGYWLSQTILSAAASELKRNNQAPAQRSGPLPPALTGEVMLESIQRLASRIESAEDRTAESIRPLAEKVHLLTRRVEEVNNRTNLSSAPMERALARMSDRLEKIEAERASQQGGRRGLFSR
jgi:hypothetical protein